MRRTDTLRPLRIMVLYGTRPEPIKMAPVVRKLRRHPDLFAPVPCTTGTNDVILDVNGYFQ